MLNCIVVKYKDALNSEHQALTNVNFNGITGRPSLVPLIEGAASPLMFQSMSFVPGEKTNDSRRMDKTSSAIYA